MQWVESSLRISLCFSCILTCKIIINTNMHRRYLYICTNCTFINIYIFPEIFVWIVVVVPIATDVWEFEFHSGEVYSIQRYVIKFVCDLKQVGGFFPGTQFSSTCLE
jgi:hypothetical protein